MPLTVVDLPYLEKLKTEIEKKVEFNVTQHRSESGYVQTAGNGLVNNSVSISLTYLKLTLDELNILISIFKSKNSSTVCRFNDRIFGNKLFKLPVSWKIIKIRTLIDAQFVFSYDITFTLISYYSY